MMEDLILTHRDTILDISGNFDSCDELEICMEFDSRSHNGMDNCTRSSIYYQTSDKLLTQ